MIPLCVNDVCPVPPLLTTNGLPRVNEPIEVFANVVPPVIVKLPTEALVAIKLPLKKLALTFAVEKLAWLRSTLLLASTSGV